MGTDDRRNLKVIAALAVITFLVVAAEVVYAFVAPPGAEAGDGEVQAGLVKSESVQAKEAPNNKNSDKAGVCSYSAKDDKLYFKRVPKPKTEGKAPEDSQIVQELKRGGSVANSPADCDRLNDAAANPPEHEHSSDGVVVDDPGSEMPDSGETVEPSPEAVEGMEVAKEIESGKTGKSSGAPKAER